MNQHEVFSACCMQDLLVISTAVHPVLLIAAAVFVRNGGILPQGLKDFKPDQIIKSKKPHVAIYSLKSNWKYRVDVVAVSSRYIVSSSGSKPLYSRGRRQCCYVLVCSV